MKTFVISVALSLIAGVASAHVYDLSYTITGVGPVDLVLTTQDTLTTGSYGDMGYLVTGVTGTRNGVAVTGVSSAYSADNVAFPASPNVDYAGFSYSTAAQSYGLFWVNASRSRAAPGSYGECYASGCNYGVSGTYNDVTGLSLVAVGAPEPATWALMLAGFGLAGGALRRRRPARA